jgi:phage gpG-like protein
MGVKILARPALKAKQLQAIPKAFNHVASYLRSQADKRIKNGVPPPNSPLTARVKQGSNTLRDLGTLMRSTASHSGNLWADCSTAAKQARILQYGGTIKAKGKALYIPAGPETRRLMKRYGAQSPGALIAAMRAEGYTFFYTPLTRAFCAVKKKGKPFALFVTRKSITIPARPFLHIDPKDERYIVHYLGIEISHALHPGKGGGS